MAKTKVPVIDTSLDPTPVADLEAWHADYDPVAAAQLDVKLDDFFGPWLSAGVASKGGVR